MGRHTDRWGPQNSSVGADEAASDNDGSFGPSTDSSQLRTHTSSDQVVHLRAYRTLLFQPERPIRATPAGRAESAQPSAPVKSRRSRAHNDPQAPMTPRPDRRLDGALRPHLVAECLRARASPIRRDHVSRNVDVARRSAIGRARHVGWVGSATCVGHRVEPELPPCLKHDAAVGDLDLLPVVVGPRPGHPIAATPLSSRRSIRSRPPSYTW